MELSKLLGEEMAVLFEERTYKTSKRMLEGAIVEMNQITLVFDESLQFKNDQLNADRLLSKIEATLQRKKQALTDRVQTTMRNNEEHRLINYMMKKDIIIGEIKNFIDCFNRLDAESRMVMYYSLFKNESNCKVELRISSSHYRINDIKHRAVEHLVNGILLNQLLNINGSESRDLGLFSCPEIGGGV